MSIDYANLALGQEVSKRTYVLDAETVSRYADAVDDHSQVYSRYGGRPVVPPMAVAALSLRGVVNDLAIPRGTLHAGQELEFNDTVFVGETLVCKAILVQNSVRGGARFIVVQLQVEDSQGQMVMGGKSTIVLPV